jgi:hypothetical protein
LYRIYKILWELFFGYALNMSLMVSATRCFFPKTFRFLQRVHDEPEYDHVQLGGRTGEAEVDEVWMGVLNRGSRGFDRMFECAMRQAGAEVYFHRGGFPEAVMIALLLEHQCRIKEVLRRLADGGGEGEWSVSRRCAGVCLGAGMGGRSRCCRDRRGVNQTLQA